MHPFRMATPRRAASPGPQPAPIAAPRARRLRRPDAGLARAWMALWLLAAALGLGGCGAMLAQNPSGGLKPANAAPAQDGTALMLKGADVVAYFKDQRFEPGLPQHQTLYQGVGFRFASADHKALFDADPQRYLPQFGGFCANGIAYGIPWGGDADSWLMHEGKLYIFGGQGSKDAFLLDVPGNLALAQRYWASEVAGSNSFFQRSWRLVFRVPHYKSGEELARMVAAARQGK